MNLQYEWHQKHAFDTPIARIALGTTANPNQAPRRAQGQPAEPACTAAPAANPILYPNGIEL